MCGKCSCGACCQNFGGFLGVFAALGMIYTVSAPDWHRVMSQEYEDGYYSYTTTYHGLWLRCLRTTSSGIQCDGYDSSIIGLPSDFQAIRITSAAAGLLVIIGLVMGMFGLSCSKACDDEMCKKCWGKTGGVIVLMAGLALVATVTYYAFYMITAPPNTNDAYYYTQYGTALYCGWASAGVAVLAGFLLTCCNCCASGSSEEKNGYVPLTPHSEYHYHVHPNDTGVGIPGNNFSVFPRVQSSAVPATF